MHSIATGGFVATLRPGSRLPTTSPVVKKHSSASQVTKPHTNSKRNTQPPNTRSTTKPSAKTVTKPSTTTTSRPPGAESDPRPTTPMPTQDSTESAQKGTAKKTRSKIEAKQSSKSCDSKPTSSAQTKPPHTQSSNASNRARSKAPRKQPRRPPKKAQQRSKTPPARHPKKASLVSLDALFSQAETPANKATRKSQNDRLGTSPSKPPTTSPSLAAPSSSEPSHPLGAVPRDPAANPPTETSVHAAAPGINMTGQPQKTPPIPLDQSDSSRASSLALDAAPGADLLVRRRRAARGAGASQRGVPVVDLDSGESGDESSRPADFFTSLGSERPTIYPESAAASPPRLPVAFPTQLPPPGPASQPIDLSVSTHDLLTPQMPTLEPAAPKKASDSAKLKPNAADANKTVYELSDGVSADEEVSNEVDTVDLR